METDLLAAFRAAVYAKIRRDLAAEAEYARTEREHVLPNLSKAIEAARSQGVCGQVWLFGSFAWGQPGERSDIDLLVEGTVDPDRLGSLVGRACGRDVHVIELELAPVSLRERVLAEGILL